MSITKITTPELLDFPNDSTSSANTSGTVIPTGNNYVSGGGGLVENSLTLSTGVSYTVTIGAGGNKNTSTVNDSTSGGNSVFHTITSIGGANATFNTTTLVGVSGGSGAGATGHYSAACTPGTQGSGTINQGYSGGTGYGRCSSDEAGGGGGGAGGIGGPAIPNIGGMGGIGIISYIKDPNGNKYAGGGGGGGRTTGGLAVSGYGGSDGTAGSNASDATVNTGGGGGSTGGNLGGLYGGNGGSGVVIVRYPSNISASLNTVSGTVDNAITGSTDLYAEITGGGSGSILFTGTPSSFAADYLVVAGGGGGDMDERGGAGAGGLRTSYGATRPATADAGEFRYNEQYGYVEYYNGSNWQQIADEYITGQPTTCLCNYPWLLSNPRSGVALYEFEDNGSDTCGNYSGTTETAMTYATGKFNKAGVFNGTNSQITVPGNLPFARDFSISIWFNPATLVAASYSSGLLLMQRGYTSTIGGTGIGFYLYGTELRPWIAINGANWYQIFSAGTLAIDTWYHTVLTRTYNSQWELFLNGTSLGTYNTQGTTADFSADPTFYFGGNVVDGSYFFDGKIDQVRMFTSALTSIQVTELYNEIACN